MRAFVDVMYYAETTLAYIGLLWGLISSSLILNLLSQQLDFYTHMLRTRKRGYLHKCNLFRLSVDCTNVAMKVVSLILKLYKCKGLHHFTADKRG